MKRSIKRFLALTLVLAMIAMPVNAAADLGDVNDILDNFTSELFTAAYREKVAELLEVVYEIDNKQAFTNAFEEAFNVLGDTNQELIDEFSITISAVEAFVTFVEDNEDTISMDNLTTYIRDGKKDEFIEALSNHETEVNQLLEDADVTADILQSGFDKLDTVFAIYEKSEDNNYEYFKYNTKTEILYLLEDDIRLLIVIANNEYPYFDDVNTLIDSMGEFVDYYNTSDDADKSIVLDYLNSNGIVEYYTPSSGGGDSSNGGTPTTPPSAGDELEDITNDLNNGDLTEEETASKVEEVVNKLAEDLANVKDQAGAYEALKSVSDVLTSTEKVVESLTEPEAKKAVVNEIVKTLDSTKDVLDLIDNAGTVSLKAKALIKNVGEIKTALDNGGQGAKKLEQAAVAIAGIAIEKAGTVKVSSSNVKTAGTKVTADLSQIDYTSQIKKAKDAEKDMQKVLADNNIAGTKGLEVKLTLEVPTAETAKEVDVTLPDLTDAFISVDKVKVESSVASFELAAGTFGKEEAKEVKLSAATVGVDTLTSAQKKAVPSGVTTVIDLNAHVDGSQVSKFNRPIEVTVPFTLEEGQDPEKVSVYLLTDDGKVKKVAGKYDPKTGTVSVMRKHFSKYFVGESNDTFVDIAGYSWARQAIEVLAGKGIVGGKGNGKFDPSAKITRAEFVALVSRMIQLEADGSALPFDDVAASAWYADDVAAAYQNGIINGKSDTKFEPTKTITRKEAAMVITNVLDYLGYSKEQNSDLIKDAFVDFDSIPSWAQKAVATTYREEIINGKPGKKFDPQGETTRAEAAVMIYKLYFGF